MTAAQKDEKSAAVAAKLRAGAVPSALDVGIAAPYDLRDHQKTAVAFMLLTPKCLILDEMGLGKSNSGLGLLSYLHARGEIGPYPKPRAIVVTTAPNVATSWKMDAFDKFFPHLRVGVCRGTKKQRVKVLNDPDWDVLLIGYETLRNDVDLLVQLSFSVAVLDEVDVLGNPNSKVTTAVRQVIRDCDRRVGMTGTLFTDKTLMKVHSIFEVLGIDQAFAPNRTHFSNMYHTWNTVETWIKRFDKRTKQKVPQKIFLKQFVSLKNVVHFRETFQPYYLRRKRGDVNIKVPELRSITKYLEPTAEQAKLYKQASQGFIKIGADKPQELERAWDHLKNICINTALVGGPDSSCKMDWLEEKLQKEWKKEKAVVFVNRLEAVKLFCKRMDESTDEDGNKGIGHVTIIGATSDKQRTEAIQKFREDPDCRVLIGTRTLVRGLNLQNAKIQVNLELLPNPGEVAQVAGRVARDGSVHDECLVVTLLMLNSLEHQWMKYVTKKQAVSDFVLEDSSEIFQQLTPKELYELIKS